MADIKNLNDFFNHELYDLYSAENQLIDALPKIAEKSKSKKLKDAFNEHLNETKNQRDRLKTVFGKLGLKTNGEKCEAMEGLIKEAESIIEETKSDDFVMDAALIAAAQKVEHYEIASYGSVITHAIDLGNDEIAEILKETLNEEKHADSKLTELSKSKINEEAK